MSSHPVYTNKNSAGSITHISEPKKGDRSFRIHILYIRKKWNVNGVLRIDGPIIIEMTGNHLRPPQAKIRQWETFSQKRLKISNLH